MAAEKIAAEMAVKKMAAEKEELQTKLDTVKKMKAAMMEDNKSLEEVKEEYEKLQTDLANESKQVYIHYHHSL